MLETNGAALVLPLLGSLLALGCLIAAYRAGHRLRLVENIPTSTTQGVFIGLVELKGSAESTDPLSSYLAGVHCVHYSWRVEEHWSRTVTESYTDSQGKRRTRTRRESGWTSVGNGGDTQPFYLKDEDGVMLIRPAGAKIEAHEVFARTCGRSDPLYYDKGPRQAIAHSSHRRRFRETAIPLHQAIYVMGRAREREDVVAPEIASDPGNTHYLISVRTEEQIRSGHRLAYWIWTVLGLLLLLAGLGWFLGSARGQGALRVAGLVAGGFVYALAAALGWLWLAYNGLVDLRQRVRQAWSQVDVQLKRRNDLVPNLVEVVKALRAHESETQAALAALRAQLSATPPGETGPDFQGLNSRLRALIERYPELKAQQGFEVLHDNLTDTENRIALARDYFNQIATHFNTRLETIPERFVAQMAGMQPKTLMAAAAFERAPVHVELAAD